MKRLALLVVLSGLMLPLSAGADWLFNCQVGDPTTRVKPGGYACHLPTSATDSPSILDTSQCENIDIFLYDNITGDGSGGTSIVDVYHCPVTATVSADNTLSCSQLAATTALSSSNPEVQGAGIVRLFLDVTAGAVSGETLLMARCSQPSGR